MGEGGALAGGGRGHGGAVMQSIVLQVVGGGDGCGNV